MMPMWRTHRPVLPDSARKWNRSPFTHCLKCWKTPAATNSSSRAVTACPGRVSHIQGGDSIVVLLTSDTGVTRVH